MHMRCVPQVASLAAAAEGGYSDMLLLGEGMERGGGGGLPQRQSRRQRLLWP